MNNWKIVSQIASVFGIIFVVFAAFAAFLNYQAVTMQAGLIPEGYLQIYVLSEMLPYLLFAVLSFGVAAVTRHTVKEEIENTPLGEQPTEPAT